MKGELFVNHRFMKSAFFILFAVLSILTQVVKAQNPEKEAMNNYAQFSKNRDIKLLKEARKNIDEAFKTEKDSSSAKINLIRAMIYSTLALVDSNRNISYQKDPLDETSYSLKQLNSIKFNIENESEIDFIKNQMAKGYLYKATTALGYSNFEEAANAFSKVDTLAPNDIQTTHNLAILYEKLAYPRKAIVYYKRLIEKNPLPAYYFNLSGLYSLTGDEILAAETLRQGRIQFPGYKDLVFKQLNYYADKQDYKNVIELLPIAFKLDEYSIPLNYLAGFSYDVTGNISKAEEYYRKVLNSDPNDYDSNYSLGLLYLSSYVKDQDKKQNMYTALSYLSKANEIDPYQLNTLQSLATLYRYSGDEIRLQRVNSKINQLKLN